jgi:hypothetical protein
VGDVHDSGVALVNGTIAIPGEELPSGVYFVRLTSRSGLVDLRVIKG